MLVAGGQTLCLLLTLLAVPVFYSVFEDVQESTIYRRIGGFFERLTRFLPKKQRPAIARQIKEDAA